MEIIEKIRNRAKDLSKTIILPESEDQRVQEAIKLIKQNGLAKLIILNKNDLSGAGKKKYAQEYFQLRKAKGISPDEAERVLAQPLYYAAMMVRNGEADGFVAGASHTTPDVARAAIQCLSVDKEFGIALGCFVMVVPGSSYGEDGIFVFADCGIVPDPNPRQLSSIAVASARMAREVLGLEPRVALLSYSTKGSSKGKSIDEIREALDLTKAAAPDLLVDGELQVDAAIDPEVAKIKYPGSVLKGEANVLIFPNLEAGNISYKLVQRLAKARALGPLILGLNKPCSDLSRGCSVDDIIDCVAITAIRAGK